MFQFRWVQWSYHVVVEFDPAWLICWGRTLTNIGVVVSRLGGTRMNKDTDQFEYVLLTIALRIAQMFDGVWSHVNSTGE